MWTTDDHSDLIPHRGRMRLIDTVTSVDANGATTSSAVGLSWPRAGAAGVDAVVLIEVIAQTAAALAGWLHRQGAPGSPPTPGLLVRVKSSRWELDRIPLGARLDTTVARLWSRGAYAAFRGEVRYRGAVVARAEIRVYSPPATGDAP